MLTLNLTFDHEVIATLEGVALARIDNPVTPYAVYAVTDDGDGYGGEYLRTEADGWDAFTRRAGLAHVDDGRDEMDDEPDETLWTLTGQAPRYILED